MKQPKKEKNLKLIDGRWYCDFTFRGRRHREFVGFTKEQARNNMTRLRADLLDVARGFKKPAGEDVAFEKFGAEFIKLYSKPNKKSWQRDQLSLDVLTRFFKGKGLSVIGPEAIEAFKAKRRTEVSDSTTNRELAFFKTMFNKAVEWGRLERNPAARVKKFREPASRERILTQEEARRLLAAAGRELRTILITALGAIPRRGEYVFWNEETKTHVKDVKTGFKAACARAKKDPDDEKDRGIVGLRFHDLRHTFASRALELGADIMTVSRILGHASIQMTAKYLHPTGESMRLTAEKVAEFLVPKRPDAGDSLPGAGVNAQIIRR